jgi:hypothetical protein
MPFVLLAASLLIIAGLALVVWAPAIQSFNLHYQPPPQTRRFFDWWKSRVVRSRLFVLSYRVVGIGWLVMGLWLVYSTAQRPAGP